MAIITIIIIVIIRVAPIRIMANRANIVITDIVSGGECKYY